MKIVIEVLPHTGEEKTVYKKFDKFPITIGRGLKNDLIIDDPYVDANHMYIDCDDNIWTVFDIGSINGLIINEESVGSKNTDIKSGDILKIGKTELKVFSEFHEVEETIKLEESHKVLDLVEHPFSALITFVLAFSVIQGWGYLEIWVEEVKMAMAGIAAIAIGIVTIWSLLWSVASRLIRNKSNFKQHISIVSIYLLVNILFWYVEAYVDFLTNGSLFSSILQYSVNFVLFSLLIYGSLSFTSRQPQIKNAISSVLFSSGVIGGIILLTWVGQNKFSPQPMYSFGMEPYLSELAPVDEVSEFMKDNEKLFNSKKLDIKK